MKGRLTIEFNYSRQEHQISEQQMNDFLIEWATKIEKEVMDIRSPLYFNYMALCYINPEKVILER